MHRYYDDPLLTPTSFFTNDHNTDDYKCTLPEDNRPTPFILESLQPCRVIPLKTPIRDTGQVRKHGVIRRQPLQER